MILGGSRIKKSRSILLSLYSLSGVASLLYLFLLMISFVHMGKTFSSYENSVTQIFVHSVQLSFVSLCLFLPIAMGISLYITLNETSPSAKIVVRILTVVRNIPLLLYGVFLLFLVGAQGVSYMLVLGLIGTSRLCHRWVMLSRRVQRIELETALSLGMGWFEIIGKLYVGPRFSAYSGHFASVVIQLLWVVTPFLCFGYYTQGEQEFVSLEIFKNLGQSTSFTSYLMVLVLVTYSCQFFFDHILDYGEMEIG